MMFSETNTLLGTRDKGFFEFDFSDQLAPI